MMGLSYREYPPPADLVRWLACFWEIQGAPEQASAAARGNAFAHRVLPDGCADLLFDLRARSGTGPRGEIVGPMTTGVVVELGDGTDLLGVRLRPGALGAFLDIAADRLLDEVVPLREAPAVLRLEAERLSELPDTPSRIALLTAACRARLAGVLRFDPIVRQALARWSHPPAVGLPTVSVLVRDVGLSERAFERRFVANVGLTPVRFRRLARLRAVLRLHSSGTQDWSELAATAGFADQSHLVRDFQAFVGLSPTRWAATQTGNAGFFQDGRITAL
jgi:AraC-like DNA-binding protein